MRSQVNKKKATHAFFFNRTMLFPLFLKSLNFLSPTESKRVFIWGRRQRSRELQGFTEVLVFVMLLSP